MTKPAYVDDEEHAPPSPAMTALTQAQIETLYKIQHDTMTKLIQAERRIKELETTKYISTSVSPTQAQIEAAAKSFYERGGDKQFPWETEKETIKVIYRKHAKAALTAAAKVGEKVDPADRYIKAQWAFEQIAKAKAEIKERCAQVLEPLMEEITCDSDFYKMGINDTVRKGQAAIRALKDKL